MEIILLCGFPGCGKSTLSQSYKDKGYVILSRDDDGRCYKDVEDKLDSLLSEQTHNVIIDNTHITIESRKPFIEVAKRHGVPIKAIWLNVPIEVCQINVLKRQWQKYNTVFYTGYSKQYKDPHIFPPAVLFKARNMFEKPTINEGFITVEEIKYNSLKPLFDPTIYVNKAIFFDIDGTLRKTEHLTHKFPIKVDEVEPYKDIEVMKTKIKKYKDRGYIFVGVSNQSGIAKKTVTEEVVCACMDETKRILDIDMEIRWCGHQSAPITCYCRKPQSGLGVYFIEKYKINPQRSKMVGDRTTDKTFATRLGMKFVHADEFFNVKP